MNPENDYLKINQESWNLRTAAHLNSPFYDLASFKKGRSSLNSIELNLLGDLQGKTVLHLQCHFGQDSISLARLGATVTGVDLSDAAIDAARVLSAETGADINFICCDVYSLPQHLDEHFDVIFTSYGVVGWLPDMERWAGIIARFLKPGGRVVFAEFHPVVWMFDDHFQSIAYSYFKRDPIIETESGTYADREAPFVKQTVSWNHSLSEVAGALLRAGLSIQSLEEYDYSPYNCFRETIEIAPQQFRIRHLDGKIPMVYSIVAAKQP